MPISWLSEPDFRTPKRRVFLPVQIGALQNGTKFGGKIWRRLVRLLNFSLHVGFTPKRGKILSNHVKTLTFAPFSCPLAHKSLKTARFGAFVITRGSLRARFGALVHEGIVAGSEKEPS